MSLRKPPTLTPARLEANRRNARKSTGPRTSRGKAQVRFNALKNGRHSRHYQDFRMSLLFLPPCAVLGTHQFLTPEEARHQLFAEAYALYRDGEPLYLEDASVGLIAALEQEQRAENDEWTTPVLSIVGGPVFPRKGFTLH